MTTRLISLRYLAAAAFFTLALAVLLTASATQAREAPALPNAPLDGAEQLPAGVTVTTLLSNMDRPIAMAFDPQGRLFYTEKVSGNVRLFANGVLQANPVINFSVNSSGERGLLGIAIDPNFNTNRYIYVFYTSGTASENRVARFTENGGVGSNPQTLFTSPQTAVNHVGGNIHFGPDGKLYISSGDNANPANSQNLTVKNGKMHRINPDGGIPADNPVFTQTGALPSIYAIGLRNSFDFTFDPVVPGRIFATENGPSCDDEMNRIEAGYNYGWRPSYPCDDDNPDPTYNTINPLWYLGTGSPAGGCCQAPTGITVYTGNQIPQWQNHLFMATYGDGAGVNGFLRHFYLNADRTQVTAVNVVQGITVNTDIETGPDGALWYIQGGGYMTGTLKRIGPLAGAATNTPLPTATTTRTATATQTQAPGNPTATSTSTTCSVQFTDVPPGSTFYQYVRCLACRNILGGYSDNTFRPNVPITRGQIAKIVSNSAGFTDAAGAQIFEDVPPSQTFYEWINRLARRGFMGGYPCSAQPGSTEPCGTGNRPYFRPGVNATRGQLAKIVSEAAGLTGTPASQTFEDVPPGSTFYVWVERLRVRAAMSGYPCGSAAEPCVGGARRPYFRPNNSVTRGQTAKIVSNTFFPGCDGVAPMRRVNTENFAYDPEILTVTAGTTIEWRNHDLDYHTVTSDNNFFDSGRMDQGAYWSHTFNNPGTYPYYCLPHPYMRGTIVVTGP